MCLAGCISARCVAGGDLYEGWEGQGGGGDGDDGGGGDDGGDGGDLGEGWAGPGEQMPWSLSLPWFVPGQVLAWYKAQG